MNVITLNQIPRIVDPIKKLGYKNLVVGGCSFTSVNFGDIYFYWQTLKKNYSNIKCLTWPELTDALSWSALPPKILKECAEAIDYQHLTYLTWPIYVRDLLGFDTIYDFSLSGSGNRHIHDSLIYGIEQLQNINLNNTLVVVMWSGYDRDDFISDADSVQSEIKYCYNNRVSTVITGGLLGSSNSAISIENVKKIKSNQSRAIENYISIVGLRHYLKSKKLNFLFTSTSSNIREVGFDPHKYYNFSQEFDLKPFIGDIAIDTIDGSHPTPLWHRLWAETVLVKRVVDTVN